MTVPSREPPALLHSARLLAVVTLIVIAVLTLTAPRWGGDQNDYEDRVSSVLLGRSPATPSLVEPGHLLWMPTLYAAGQLYPYQDAAALRVGVSEAGHVLAGVSVTIAAAALAWVVVALFGHFWLGVLAAAMLLGMHGVLNYSQVGMSYIASLAAASASLALSVAAARRQSAALSLTAGVAAALSVLFWLPFVLVLPALFAAQPLLSSGDGHRWRLHLLLMIGACAAVGLASYGIAAGIAGVDPVHFSVWIAGASHSIEGSGGFARSVLGLARSFVFMDEDPGVVKRYLQGDPFYPVDRGSLVMLPLWPRLALFYALAGGICLLAAVRREGRAVLGLLIIAAVPCLGFGLMWQGGDVERYLALYPFVVLTSCAAVVHARESVAARLVLAGMAMVAANNLYAFAEPVVSKEMRAAIGRTDCGGSIGPRSLIILPNSHDPLMRVYRVARYGGLFPKEAVVVAAFIPQFSAVPGWKQAISRSMLDAHDAGRDVWISDRAREPRPSLQSQWLEGEDARISWLDLHNFFGSLSVVELCGNPDSFSKVQFDETTTNVLKSAAMPASAHFGGPTSKQVVQWLSSATER